MKYYLIKGPDTIGECGKCPITDCYHEEKNSPSVAPGVCPLRENKAHPVSNSETISDKALISSIRKWAYEKNGGTYGPCSTLCPFYYKPCHPIGSDKCHARLVKFFRANAKRMKK